jgi:hypothetical protein
MAFRQILSKAIFPTFEKDLVKTLGKEVKSMDTMLGCHLAPQVYAYEQPAHGAFSGSAPRNAPHVVRVNYPAPTKGIFH